MRQKESDCYLLLSLSGKKIHLLKMQSSTSTYSVVWLHQALERAITYLYLKGFIG